jgi:molybdopterin-biosynthesis enzyme MoeA-like protein
MTLLLQAAELDPPMTVRYPSLVWEFHLILEFIDITYASLAKSFNQPLVHHPETLTRMAALSRIRKLASQQNAEQRAAQQRMALFPEKAEVIFVGEDIWVVSHLVQRRQMPIWYQIQPVVRLEGRLCIFPGIPSLFQRMLTALTPFLPLPPKSERPLRIQVFTE